jgi:hypothetical protein
MSTVIHVDVNSCLIINLLHSMSFMSNAIHVSVNSHLTIDFFHSMSSMSLMFSAPTVVNYDVPNVPQISSLFVYAPTIPHPHYLDIEAAARTSTAVDSVRRLGRSCCVSMTFTMYLEMS